MRIPIVQLSSSIFQPKTPKGKTPNGKTPNSKPTKPSKEVVVEESTPVSVKNKRKSLSNEQPSGKKSKLKRASIAKSKNSSGFIEEDM